MRWAGSKGRWPDMDIPLQILPMIEFKERLRKNIADALEKAGYKAFKYKPALPSRPSQLHSKVGAGIRLGKEGSPALKQDFANVMRDIAHMAILSSPERLLGELGGRVMKSPSAMNILDFVAGVKAVYGTDALPLFSRRQLLRHCSLAGLEEDVERAVVSTAKDLGWLND